MLNSSLAWARIHMFFNKLRLCIVLFAIGISPSLFAKPVKIVTITQDFASIARSVGGDYVTVTSLIDGSRNLHHITPKPSMVRAVKKADMIIRLGMQQDAWIDGLIQAARNADIFYVCCKYVLACHKPQHPSLNS